MDDVFSWQDLMTVLVSSSSPSELPPPLLAFLVFFSVVISSSLKSKASKHILYARKPRLNAVAVQVGRYDDVVLRVGGSKTEQTRVISRRDIIMALPFETRSIVLARRAIGKC